MPSTTNHAAPPISRLSQGTQTEQLEVQVSVIGGPIEVFTVDHHRSPRWDYKVPCQCYAASVTGLGRNLRSSLIPR